MNLNKNFVRMFAAAAVLFAALSPESQAIPMGPKIYVGALGGLSAFTESTTNLSFTPFTYGGTAGVVLPGGFGIGAHVSRFGYSYSLLGVTASLTQLNLYGELNYFISILHIGAKVGTSMLNIAVTGIPDTSTSTTNYGPTVGVDIPLGLFSIGGEASYMLYSGGGSSILALGAIKLSL